MGTYNKTEKIIKKCAVCPTDFVTSGYLVSIGKGKFCSKKCTDIYKVGKESKVKGRGSSEKQCLLCSSNFIVKASHIKHKTGKYCSRLCSDKSKIGKESNAKNKHWKLSEQAKINISNSHREEKNPNWKGGITPQHLKIRKSKEYKDWRITVFERDNFTCQECSSRGVELHADHIKPFAYYPELRLVIENGRTLCVPCHKKTETYGGKVIRLKKELNYV
jgi:5-methylcytosine-specific restriction endonuclease McrA